MKTKRLAIVICSFGVLLLLLLYFSRFSAINEGKFELKVIPESLDLCIGKYRNLTVIINSTGYEGYVVLEPKYSFEDKEVQGKLTYEILPFSKENKWHLSSNGKLELTFRMKWEGMSGRMHLRIVGYGNYGKENQFEIESNTVIIQLTPAT